MKFQLIRNATVRLEYGNITILIDPMLGPKHSFGSFAGIEDNPTVELPIPASEIFAGVDLILVSHLHEDHFDAAAQTLDNKAIPILCQPGDREKIEAHGFNNVVELEKETQWQHVLIARTGGEHGTGPWADLLNPVSGFVFQFPDEPTLYWIGDSVWCEVVETALAKVQPDVIVTHSGGAEIRDSGPIIMDVTQTIRVCQSQASAVVIATHMEALDHCKTTRKQLHAAALEADINPDHLLILEDGELVEIN